MKSQSLRSTLQTFLLLIGSLVTSQLHAISPASELFPAFPGAEGAGAYTPGGRGGKIFVVNTLEDYYPGKEKPIPGSLRQAIDADMPRTIVFDVGGIIDLKNELEIRNPFITIAGQTAPGNGITLRRHALEVKTHDVIVRYLRIRPGDLAGEEMDALSCSAQNVIIDHCSVSWAIDETLSTNGDSQDLTVQWCFITESLNDSLHKKGEHGYGSLISGPGEISYHHNLYAFHHSRNPRPGDILLDFRNNTIVGWGIRPGYNRDNVTLMNYVGNTLIPYPYSKFPQAAFHTEFLPDDPRMRFYLRDNSHLGTPEGTRDNSLLIAPPEKKTRDSILPLLVNTPFPTCSVATDPTELAHQKVLDSAGADLPQRDAVDQRVVDQIRNRTGGIINSPKDVGGWPELPPSTIAKGRFASYKETPDSDKDRDGYTDLEELLNSTNPDQPDPWIYPPTVQAALGTEFVGTNSIQLACRTPNAVIRYTLDGSEPTTDSPTYQSPLTINRPLTLRTASFLDGHPSHVRTLPLRQLNPLPPVNVTSPQPGLAFEYYEHPDFRGEGWNDLLPVRTGVNPRITLEPCNTKPAGFGIRYDGYIDVPADGIYTFWLRCSPRGELFLGPDKNSLLLESQSRRRENSSRIALQAGKHPIAFRIFYRSDVDRTLDIDYAGPGIERQPLPAAVLSH